MMMDVPSTAPSKKAPLASIVGLALALLWPFVFLAFSHAGSGSLADPRQDQAVLIREWSVSGLVLMIILFWERLPLASVGLKIPRLADFGWMLMMIVAIFVGNGLALALGSMLTNGHTTPGAGVLAGVAAVPVAMRFALAITAGICEEFLTRGYAIERLTALTGSRFFGAAIPCVLFTLGHARLYGFSVGLLPVLATAIGATALYVWRRNLVVNMVMHALIDLFGLFLQTPGGHH